MEFLGISGPEAIIIAVVVLVVLGPKGMSEAARRILEVRRRWLEVSASFRKQSDQAMAQLRVPDVVLPHAWLRPRDDPPHVRSQP